MDQQDAHVGDEEGVPMYKEDGENNSRTFMISQQCEVSTSRIKFDLKHESKLLFDLAIPSVALQLSMYFLFPQTASMIGRHLGTEELAGFSLASLTGNLTCLSIIIGALTATETLMPRAFGMGDYAEVGLIAVRGFVVCTLLLAIPLIPLITCMDSILMALGQDPTASKLASDWIRIYLLGLPATLLFRVIQRFLAAQNVVWPLVYAGLVGCFLVEPTLLQTFVPTMGFLGSGVALVLTQTTQALLLMLYLNFQHVHHPETWPGLSFSLLKHAIEPAPMIHFMKLSLGGVLSLSEWWFWEIICFIAGTFGVIPLCVHTIAYQLIPLLFMVPLGISIGMSIRIGTVLAHDVEKAKTIAKYSVALTCVVAVCMSTLLYKLKRPIVLLFTSDAEGCDDIWMKLCMDVIVLFIFSINAGILRALGLQWRMALSIFVVLWCGALPVMYHYSVVKGGGLDSLWTLLPCFYAILDVVTFLCYYTANWHVISKGINERAHRESVLLGEVPDESTYLIHRERAESIGREFRRSIA
eukprot:scaffold34316_cov40-Attheya_sp.AAC.1